MISSLPNNHADQRRDRQPRRYLHDPRDPSLLLVASLFRGLLELVQFSGTSCPVSVCQDAEPRDYEPDRHLSHPGASFSESLATLLRNVLRCGQQQANQ
ncbi:unnamed protein product, partial [Brenthis ino]